LLGGLGVGAATYSGQLQLAVPAYNFGYALGSKIKEITGFGAYHVRSNVLMGQVPQVSNPSDVEGGLVISHREYLGDVITSATPGAFSIQDFVINPGTARTWEWLAQIAVNYEQWKPQGILFAFKSTSADALNSTNTALGTVIMATQYNPYNGDFKTAAEMMSYEYSTSGRPSEDIIHMIECDPHQGAISTFFTQTKNISLSADGDRRFLQLGKFYLATTGFQGAKVNIGQLWVTYQICLLKPKLFQSLGLANDFFETIYAGASVNASSTYVGLLPFPNTLNPMNSISWTGRGPSQELWVDNDSLTTIIHWPIYAFGVSYFIQIEFATASASTNVTYTTSQGDGDANATPFVVFMDYRADTVRQKHIIQGIVNVPGGSLIPTPNNNPSVKLTLDANIAYTACQWRIAQVPYPQALY